VRLFGAALLALTLLVPGAIFAQGSLLSPMSMQQQVALARDGNITINGKAANQHSIDTLPDSYVFRYKALDAPGRVIDRLTVRLLLPSSIKTSALDADIIAVHGVGQTEVKIVSDSTIDFIATAVGPEATITITAGMPKSALDLSPARQVIADLTVLSFTDLLGLSSIIPALILLGAIGLVLTRLPDILLRPAPNIATLPARLPPAYVGVLLTGNVGKKEIAATIIDLAHRGYIDIIARKDGEYGFSKKNDWQYDKTLLAFERQFLDQLTSKTFITADTKITQNLNSHVWNDAVSQGIELIYSEMTRLGYFAANPKRSHVTIRTVGIVLFFLSAIGFGLTLLYFGQQPLVAIPWLVSLAISPVIIRLALLVPPRTAIGRQQAALWAGFRRYISADEYFRYPGDAEQFDQYLAYAVAFGVEGKWTSRFLKVPCRIPDWFYSEASLVDSYEVLSERLFEVVDTISQRFSLSRNPTSV
jgi:hypothetical protein